MILSTLIVFFDTTKLKGSIAHQMSTVWWQLFLLFLGPQPMNSIPSTWLKWRAPSGLLRSDPASTCSTLFRQPLRSRSRLQSTAGPKRWLPKSSQIWRSVSFQKCKVILWGLFTELSPPKMGNPVSLIFYPRIMFTGNGRHQHIEGEGLQAENSAWSHLHHDENEKKDVLFPHCR